MKFVYYYSYKTSIRIKRIDIQYKILKKVDILWRGGGRLKLMKCKKNNCVIVG
jgi:hypothetical protein